jgi:hypothetical protein
MRECQVIRFREQKTERISGKNRYMREFNKMQIQIVKKVLELFFVVCFFSGCLPSSPTKGRKTVKEEESSAVATSTPDDSNDPFSDELNFLQYGSTTTTSTLTIALDFKDSMYLRGNQIHHYLRARDPDIILCVAGYFPTSSSKQLGVLSAVSQSFHNYSTGEREYYFYIQSEDESQNTGHCQTSDVSNTLSSLYPGASKAYVISNVCSGCGGQFDSTAFILMDTGGNQVSDITMTHLGLRLDSNLNTGTDTTGNGAPFCDDSGDCSSLGYNCCVNGQCVNDGQLITTYTAADSQYDDFLDAIAAVTPNPNDFVNYPDFFHVCGSDPLSTAVPDATADVEATAEADYRYKKELYDCTSPGDDEMAICTVYYPTAAATIASGSNDFYTTDDDLNFTTVYSGSGAKPLSTLSVYEIEFGGAVIYNEDTVPLPTAVAFGGVNDNLTAKSVATVTFTPNSTARDGVLKVKFKIDGSCEDINSYLAKCWKYYVQGQDDGIVSDHESSSQYFDLPAYADVTRSINVYVDGARNYSGVQYSLTTNGSNNSVLFNSTYNVQPTQKIKIEYYVNKTTYPNIIIQKATALAVIDTMCDCSGQSECLLKPVVLEDDGDDDASNDVIVDYACDYPTPVTSELPLQQTVYVSSKAAPMRYYDVGGVAKDEPDGNDLSPEGTPFSYTSDDMLKPNNTTSTIGFNEIYGTFDVNNSDAPVPPAKVDLVKGRSYDIFVDLGSYSSCQDCGTDYYTSLAKIFPDNFLYKGGGYAPDVTRTSRTESSTFIGGQYRADDLLFGRACFVPATMIPWTHTESDDAVTNRQNRKAAQHFLFANGYQRDWYGFDYGSLIGSFDGITWFSVGNQRRIKADGNKLYLAVNSYFGDLTSNANFQVEVSEVTSVYGSGSYVEHDDLSDGAECRKQHFCDNDRDCIGKLGWDYACEEVGNIYTSWPVFDSSGVEIPQGTGNENYKQITTLVDGTNGQNKRCVYRGRGSPCVQAYAAVTPTATFNQSSETGLLSCSMANHCEGLTTSKFNNAISRFGKSQAVQNSSSSVTIGDEDTFGLSARIVGRPLYINGTESPGTTAKSTLSSNSVDSICIPGRATRASGVETLEDLHSTTPSETFDLADRVLGIGMVPAPTPSSTEDFMFASCSVLNNEDVDGHPQDYFHMNAPTTIMRTSNELKERSVTQNLSTTHLEIYQSEASMPLATPFATPDDPVETQVHQQNRCLKAPGAACFTNFDCGPSDFISDRIAGVDESFPDMNKYETKFWQEDMICNNAGSYTVDSETDYDLSKNVCCRDIDKKLTVATAQGTPTTFYPNKAAGVDIGINNSMRYSRMNILYYLGINQPTEYPWLRSPSNDSNHSYGSPTTGDELHLPQFKSLDHIGVNSCCSKNWVRNFNEDDNGGGHTWDPSKMQQFDKTNLECINYRYADGATFTNCDDPENQDDTLCSLRNMTNSEVKAYSDYFASLNLTGIPQAYVLTPYNTSGSLDDDYQDVGCTFEPFSLAFNPNSGGDNVKPIPGTIKYPGYQSGGGGAADDDYTAVAELIHSNSGSSRTYFSTNDTTNFDDDIKKVFSEDTLSCCLPTGVEYPHDIEDSQCCTGMAYDDGDTVDKRCCLPDYSNVSLYLNRYVSSEANYLPDENFDDLTGYIKDPMIAEQVALAKRMCCSENVYMGVAAGYLPIPNRTGGDDAEGQRQRFIFSDGASDSPNNEYFDYGLRWPTNVYCIPPDVDATTISDGGSASD